MWVKRKRVETLEDEVEDLKRKIRRLITDSHHVTTSYNQLLTALCDSLGKYYHWIPESPGHYELRDKEK